MRECRKYLDDWYKNTTERPFPFADEKCPERLMMATHRSHGIALRALTRDTAILHELIGAAANDRSIEELKSVDERLEVLADTLALMSVGAYRLSAGPIDNMLLSMSDGFAGEWRVTSVILSRTYTKMRFCGVKYDFNEFDRYYDEVEVEIHDPMRMEWLFRFHINHKLVNRRACETLLRARTLWRDRILTARAAEAL
jgi:hypothetical protein